MNAIISLSVIFLSALVYASLSLDLGAMLLLYHSVKSRFVSKKSRILVTNYLLGSLTMIFLGLAAGLFLVFFVSGGPLDIRVLSIITGALGVISLVAWFFYYRCGRSTELWLPRSVSRYISTRASLTSSRTEAFSLGMLTAFAEFPFSALLSVVAADSLISLNTSLALPAVLMYLLIAILPLLIVRLFFTRGKTIVDVQKWRIKNIFFIRFVTGLGFFVLAAFIFAFKILGNI